jgi:hypothetical protein
MRLPDVNGRFGSGRSPGGGPPFGAPPHGHRALDLALPMHFIEKFKQLGAFQNICSHAIILESKDLFFGASASFKSAPAASSSLN